VRPEDIGLPPAPSPTSDAAGSAAILTEDEAAPAKVMLVADIYPVDASGDRGTQLIQLSGWSS
jgi:hypothetical protein